MSSETPSADAPVGYVLKMYPRFSETFVVSEILAREAAGERVVIFSLRPPSDPRFHPELARVAAPVIQIPRAHSARSLWASVQEAAADPACAAGLPDALPQLARAGHDDAQQALDLARLAAEHGVRHLHAHFGSVATTVARLAARVLGRPYSFTAHAKDIFHESVEDADLQAKLQDAHHVVTISEYNRQHLQRRFPAAATTRLHLVRNGLELARFPWNAPGELASPPRLLAVGRLVEKKGFGLLLEALARLRHEGFDATCDIVGEGPLRPALESAITELGLDDRARLLGARTQEELQSLLRGADVLVGPFVIAADGNADGLPTVLLEAMACGTPVVAADVTAVGEVVRDRETGRLVPSGDVPALAVAVRESLECSAAERERRSRAARDLIERDYDSTRQARTLRALTTAEGRGDRSTADGPTCRALPTDPDPSAPAVPAGPAHPVPAEDAFPAPAEAALTGGRS